MEVQHIDYSAVDKICSKDECMGCGLCVDRCPVSCIEMVTDSVGFWFPKVSYSECIKCGKCVNNCPSIHVIKNESKDYQQKYYLAWNKNDEIRYNSSSGGVFAALSCAILKNQGIVIGAAYDDDFLVHHIAVADKNQLDMLKKSKYLQSDCKGIYNIIESFLKENKLVLFTGTPCQCAAVKKVFNQYSNLFICDVICHGVQSPKIFKDALSYMEKKVGAKCTGIDFRSKTKGWANACTTFVRFKNGKVINKRANDIPIGAAFLKNLDIRKCCESCKYRTLERTGDITIGDFWAIRDNREYIKKYRDLGFSSMLVNSEKGKWLLDEISDYLYIEKKTESEIKAQNNPLYKQFNPNPLRKEFLEEYVNNPFETIWKKYLKPDKKTVLRWHLLSFARNHGLLNVYLKLRGIK